MVSYISRGNRSSLSQDQKDFLSKIVPLSRLISDWVRDKAIFTRTRIVSPILTCVVLTDIITESNWGTHPLAQSHFNKKFSNNLALLESDSLWEGRNQDYEGRSYKCYQDWIHFATNYSDILIFSRLYSDLFNTTDPSKQIRVLARYKNNSQLYIPKAEAALDFYNLSEFI